MNSGPRRPLRILFEPPASPDNWRMTGGFNWPSPSYGSVPTCEWTDDCGARICLPGRHRKFAATVDKPRVGRCSVLIENASHFFKRSALLLRERVLQVTLCTMQLAADMGI
jgi:hypothetical protein